MSEKTINFINTIGVLARNEYLSRDRWVLPSVCIAQAALESGWNLEASTLFGIKGEGFTATTSEYYNDHYVEIQDSFRSYPNVASAVVGYYDFITETPRYAGVVNNADYKDAVDKLIHTTDGAAYATSPTYIDNIILIIEQFDLTSWDTRDEDLGPVPEQPDDNTDTMYHEGDIVEYDRIYESSTSEEAYTPLAGFTSGTITKVIPDASNPYLINDGTGWINDSCIISSGDGNSQQSEADNSSIKVGDKVRVLVNATYDGGSFIMYYDTYDVLEVNGDRAVIGIGDTVTCAINTCNIERV